MLLKINDKREDSIKDLENTLNSVNVNGVIKVDGKYRDYTYMINEVYYDRIESQYLLEINDEIIKELAKKYHLYFEINDHSVGEEVNDDTLIPLHYYTIDIVDIKPKRFVDVDIESHFAGFTTKREVKNIDIMKIPNTILDVCDSLSDSYKKIGIILNSESSVDEIYVIRNNGTLTGIKYTFCYNRERKGILLSCVRVEGEKDYKECKVGDTLHQSEHLIEKPSEDITRLKEIDDGMIDLCMRIRKDRK